MFSSKKKLDPWEDKIAEKAHQRFSKLTSNPLFWAITALGAIVAFCSFVIAGPSLIFLLGAAIVAVNIGRAILRHWKEIFYESSLLFVSLRNLVKPSKYPWWNKIDENLFLGALPIKEKKHLEKISSRAKAILTLLEEFELENRWPFTTAISADDWGKNGVATCRIGAVDIEGVKIEDIEKGVEFIREHIEQGVYVHCKAGVGRSATVVACYLLKYGLRSGKKFSSPAEVIAYVYEKRDQVLLREAHRKAVIEKYFVTLPPLL